MLSAETFRHAARFMHGNILILTVTDALGNFSRAMTFAYAPLFVLALGGRPEQIGFIDALGPVMGLLLFPIAGYITDHAGRVRLIVLTGYLSGAFFLLYVIAPNWQVVAVATFLRGVIALQFPGRSAIVADSLAPGDRGRGVATMRTLSGTLSIVAPFVAGWVIEIYGPNWGMRLLYGVMMVSLLAAAAIQQRYLVETSPNAGHALQVRELWHALRDAYQGLPSLILRLPPSLRALAAVLVLGFMANAVVSPFWVVYAIQEVELSAAAWGTVLLLETVLRNLLFIPMGAMVDRWGRTRMLLAALIMALVTMPLFVLAHSFVAVLAIRLTVAVSQATFVPASVALMADLVPRPLRGRVMAALGQGGLMLGSAGGGTGGPGTGFLMTLPLMLASIAGGSLYAARPFFPWLFALIVLIIAITLVLLFIRDPANAEE